MSEPPIGITESQRYDKQAYVRLWTREWDSLRVLVGSVLPRVLNHFPEAVGVWVVNGSAKCGKAVD
jgi:hypothetical protein